jgi:hypothetical protein
MTDTEKKGKKREDRVIRPGRAAAATPADLGSEALVVPELRRRKRLPYVGLPKR